MSQWAYSDLYDRGYVLPEAQVEVQAGYSRLAEWYLTGCLAFLLIYATFANAFAGMAGSRNYLVGQLTGYAVLPTEVYFLSIGLLIGVVIFMVGRSGPAYVPTMGVWAFLAYVGIVLLGTVRGYLNGTPFWYVDSRGLLLTAIVVPWAAVLGQSVRLDVVAKWIIWLGLPLAVINAIRGYQFISLGPRVSSAMNEQTRALGLGLESDLALLAVFSLALARSLSRGGKGAWMAVILAVGVIGPLSKPSIFAFVVLVLFMFTFGSYAGARSGIVNYKKGLLALIVLGAALFGVMVVWLSLRGGAGLEFLEQRFFKTQLDISKRDLSTGRFDLWMYGLKVWKSNPLLGVGLGTRAPKSGTYRWIVYHNTWVKMLAEMGLVGLTVVFTGILLWFRRALRALRLEVGVGRFWPRLGLISFVVAMLVVCSYDEPLSAYTFDYILWIAVALEAAAHTQVLRGVVGAWPEESLLESEQVQYGRQLS